MVETKFVVPELNYTNSEIYCYIDFKVCIWSTMHKSNVLNISISFLVICPRPTTCLSLLQVCRFQEGQVEDPHHANFVFYQKIMGHMLWWPLCSTDNDNFFASKRNTAHLYDSPTRVPSTLTKTPSSPTILRPTLPQTLISSKKFQPWFKALHDTPLQDKRDYLLRHRFG